MYVCICMKYIYRNICTIIHSGHCRSIVYSSSYHTYYTWRRWNSTYSTLVTVESTLLSQFGKGKRMKDQWNESFRFLRDFWQSSRQMTIDWFWFPLSALHGKVTRVERIYTRSRYDLLFRHSPLFHVKAVLAFPLGKNPRHTMGTNAWTVHRVIS